MWSEKKLRVSIGSLQNKQTNKKLCMYVHIVYTQRKLEENICMVISGAWWYVFLFSSFSLSDLSMQETYALLI